MHSRTENRRHQLSGSRGGFTAVELMLVLVIMSIVAVLGMDTIVTFEANQRADRAAREALVFFRFARHLAMTTGNNAEVSIDTTNNKFSVYLMSNGSTWDVNPYSVSFASGGMMQMNLNSERELMGTTMSVSPNGTTAFVYSAVGSCGTSGSVTFSFGSKTKTLTIPTVGDPQM